MKNKEIKDKFNEEYGQIKYYGEFVSSCFNWMTLDENKKNAKRLENITKKERD